VKNFTISDVIGDDLGSIGSGPCVPDDSSAAEVRLALTSAGLWEKIPDAFRTILTAVENGFAPETPKPGDPAFRNLETRLVASNRLALEAMANQATQLGITARVMGADLAGEASETGRRLATLLLTYSDPAIPQPALHKNATLLVWGGETTVTLGQNPGRGGRNQELALAAAEVLAAGSSPARDRVTIMSAGTDGRDGPTDAAGAIVDASTWAAIRAAGRDPGRDLWAHNANPSLAAGHALLITGMTGTNVMDVVAGLIMPAESARQA
jgi:hydroxypyruvate reductase